MRLHIGTILSFAALSANLQAAEGVYEWPLRIAIDDGTSDSELFVEFDHLVVDPKRWPTGAATLSKAGECSPRQTRTKCSAVASVDWQRGVAITVPLNDEPPDVTISSDSPIDENARNRIRAILTSAGHGDHIEFVDGVDANRRAGRADDTM